MWCPLEASPDPRDTDQQPLHYPHSPKRTMDVSLTASNETEETKLENRQNEQDVTVDDSADRVPTITPLPRRELRWLANKYIVEAKAARDKAKEASDAGDKDKQNRESANAIRYAFRANGLAEAMKQHTDPVKIMLDPEDKKACMLRLAEEGVALASVEAGRPMQLV